MRWNLWVVLTLLTLSSLGCSTMQSKPGIEVSPPPAICMEVCPIMPKMEHPREWMIEMVDLYTACAVQNSLCRSELRRQYAP